METASICIIDIGSNSVRCMKAFVRDGKLVATSKKLYTARLADGLLSTGRLAQARMLDAAQAIRHFCLEARAEGFPVYAYATSAVRDAQNREDFLALLEQLCSLKVMVLSGEEEGRYAYLGASGGKGTLIDIGGGSMQLVNGDRAISFPIGCVRAKDLAPIDSLPAAHLRISAALDALLPSDTVNMGFSAPYTGVGGSITTIGALLLGQNVYDGTQLDHVHITPAALNELMDRLFALGDKRKEHPLLVKRHDVILYGGLLLSCLMERFCVDSITPCDRDGMEGLAESILHKQGSLPA